MNLSKLTYSKGDGTLELREVPAGNTVSDKAMLSEGSVKFVAGYQKGEPVQDPSFIFIISGGEKREKDYFTLLRQDDGVGNRLKIVFVSKEGQGMPPEAMWKEAEECLDEGCLEEDGKVYSIIEGDKVYLLSDVDEYAPSLQRLLPICGEELCCQWIISNPAFEIWLFYHFFDSPEQLSDCIDMEVKMRSQWLKRRLNELVAGGINPVQAIKNMPTAIGNSRKNYKEDKPLPKLFSTQMHIVAEHILLVTGDAFQKMLKLQHEKAKTFLENKVASAADL